MRGRKEKLLESFLKEELPEWVYSFPGPFQKHSSEETVRKLLTTEFRTLLIEWTDEYMGSELTNIVIPVVRFEGLEPTIKLMILIANPEDTEKLGRLHVSKDPSIFPFPQDNVVNTPDIKEWRQIREEIIDAFLPKSNLSMTVNIVDAYARTWCTRLKTVKGGVVDIHSELLHTALSIYCASLLGVHDPFDKPFAESVPKDSEPVRNLFNLKLDKLRKDKTYVTELMTTGRTFIDRLLEKAASPKHVTPLVQGLLKIENRKTRRANMMALLVGGHDTTAYTMQFLLFELARHPIFQARARQESIQFYKEFEASGKNIKYEDLRKLVFLRRCITESLRLWNAAITVFDRTCLRSDKISGLNGELVEIPEGIQFNFWYYGQHHSEKLWGNDAMSFNPDREFHNHELQLGNVGEPEFVCYTPYTARFHPFSVPRRDCIGKNFAFIEMEILMSRFLQSFLFELAEPTCLEAGVKVGSGEIFSEWCKGSEGLIQPETLKLRILPLDFRMASSKL